jgi:hypothetical protein
MIGPEGGYVVVGIRFYTGSLSTQPRAETAGVGEFLGMTLVNT